MESAKRPRLSDGRILVSVFLTIMGALFALSALVFEQAPPRYTVFAVSGVMFLGAIVGFVLAFRRRPG